MEVVGRRLIIRTVPGPGVPHVSPQLRDVGTAEDDASKFGAVRESS